MLVCEHIIERMHERGVSDFGITGAWGLERTRSQFYLASDYCQFFSFRFFLLCWSGFHDPKCSSDYVVFSHGDGNSYREPSRVASRPQKILAISGYITQLGSSISGTTLARMAKGQARQLFYWLVFKSEHYQIWRR